MRYSLEDVQALFGADVLNDAGLYLERGRVAQPDIRQDGSLITSLIESPGHRPYRVYVRIEGRNGLPPCIRGECSCSERCNCKHVAAVLLRAIEGEEGLAGDDLDAAFRGPCPRCRRGTAIRPGSASDCCICCFRDEHRIQVSRSRRAVPGSSRRADLTICVIISRSGPRGDGSPGFCSMWTLSRLPS